MDIIKTLALSKGLKYIAVMVYLGGFASVVLTQKYGLFAITLLIALCAYIASIVYELSFIWRAFNPKEVVEFPKKIAKKKAVRKK